jgi:hypothetical protein
MQQKSLSVWLIHGGYHLDQDVLFVLLTDLDATLGDHGAVGLVNDTIDLLQVVRVRDDLVVGENILLDAGSATVIQPATHLCRSTGT